MPERRRVSNVTARTTDGSRDEEEMFYDARENADQSINSYNGNTSISVNDDEMESSELEFQSPCEFPRTRY